MSKGVGTTTVAGDGEVHEPRPSRPGRSRWPAPTWWPAGEARLQLALGLALTIGAPIVAALSGSAFWSYTLALMNVLIVVAIGQNFLVADARQMSFGQGAVFGLGGYGAAIAATRWGWPFLASMGAATVVGLVVGAIFALPALRVSGFYLGFVTLAVALLLPDLLTEYGDVTGGVSGILHRSDWLPSSLLGEMTRMHALAALAAAVTLALHAISRRTVLGRKIRVAGESPEAAMSMGMHPGRLRAAAFMVACAATGAAGSLYLGLVEYVSPTAFAVDLSLFFLFAIVVGGVGQLIAPIVGVWILHVVPDVWLADRIDYRLLAYGVVTLVLMLVFRDGVVGTLVALLRRVRPRHSQGDVSLAARCIDLAGRTAASSVADDEVILEVHDVHKRFSELVALDHVSFEVRRGEILGLVGPNGSGKTTLLNVVSGLLRGDGGTLTLRGEDITRTSASARARRGLGRTFQTPKVFHDLTLGENARVGAESVGADLSGVDSVLDAASAGAPIGDLTHSRRRLLELLRVLAMAPDLMLLDEPAAGLSPAERQDFVEVLRTLRDEHGKTVVLVEHDLGLVTSVADRVVVLAAGELVASGSPDEILADDAIHTLFMGRRGA